MRPRKIRISISQANWIAASLLLALTPLRGESAPAAHPFILKDPSRVDGSNLRKVIPLDELPARVQHPAGGVHLIPDLSDQRDGYAVFYLINDTDEPIRGIIGPSSNVWSEVRIGGHWFDRKPIKPGCGTTFPPRDLPARSALAVSGITPASGDTDAMIRYRSWANGVYFSTPPIRGKYVAAELAEVMANAGRCDTLHREFKMGLIEGRWGDNLVAKNPEEFAAMLELLRNSQQCLEGRQLIIDWVSDEISSDLQFRERIKAILTDAWLAHRDEQMLVDRCLAAIQNTSDPAYGTPENCPGVVWRFLTFRNPNHLHSSRSRDYRKPLPESSKRLVELAVEALDGDDLAAGDSAAQFLATHSFGVRSYPEEQVIRFLDDQREPRIRAGLAGLARRNIGNQAGPWMQQWIGKDDALLWEAYFVLLPSLDNQPQEWETKVIDHFLATRPLDFLQRLQGNRSSRKKEEALRAKGDALRSLLREELQPERLEYWNQLTKSKKNQSADYPESSNYRGLCNAIRLVASIGDPKDTALLQQYLGHPATGRVSSSPKDGTKLDFPVRSAAVMALRERGHDIPETVATKLVIPETGNEQAANPISHSRWTWIITSLLLLSLSIWLIRKRIDRGESRPQP
ncbi:hypothetical protein [Haloferula sp.]|uniref:hypothetical protein n=1 Tax=Haloferula sp. TaxID=2497595 RepID=UPI003C777CA4